MIPEPILHYLGNWIMERRTLGFLVLTAGGEIRLWGGALDLLGIDDLQEGKPVADRLIFMEGLLPMSRPSMHLTMIKLDERHSLDVHLFKIENGYGLILMDAAETEKHLGVWQQRANEMALHRSDPQMSPEGASPATGDSLESFLGTLNIAALAMDSQGDFALIGRAPSWLEKVCPNLAQHICDLSPKNDFSFLDNFLHDAHEFWNRETPGFVKSGLWIETDDEANEHLLEATAMNTGKMKLLLISRDICMIDEKRALIQKGREFALTQGAFKRLQDELEARVRLHTEELEQANARLAEELAQRKQLEYERSQLALHLQQAQKMEAIGTMAGGIAHDFNNILSAVIGFSELSLAEIPVGSRLHTNLQQVLAAGQRAKGLIRQILTFSRQSKPEMQPVQLGSLTREALKLLRASLPASIEIKQDIRSQGYVVADPTQMHQVIMNLCTNAGQAMSAEGGRLELSVRDRHLGPEEIADHPDLQPGPFLELVVKDNGHGIPPEIQNRIFEPFFTTKAKEQGTGMGLSVVHGIVKSCQGSIRVTGRLKQGTAFHVLLPAMPEIKVQHKPAAANLLGGSERILFVDDELPIVNLAVQGLGLMGYRVQAETDSPRALSIFCESPEFFDLVITDMNMPNLTGKQLALEMLKIRPDLPIILCSGFSEPISEQSADELGIRGYLVKPIGIKELAKTVRTILDAK
jgi:signal transduction histidine kinase